MSQPERGQTRFHRTGGRHVWPSIASTCPYPLKQADSDVASPLSPCGLCRQVIREFCAQAMPILLVPCDYEKRLANGEPDGGVKETSIAALLPDSFGPEDLERPRPGAQ